MSDELVYTPGEDDSFLELSNTPTGKLFRKHILSTGPLYHDAVQGGVVNIDEAFLESVVRNFNDHVVSHVQAPVVDEKNRHTQNPLANIGEVVKMTVENGKAYAYLDVRDESAAPKIGKTLLGASALLDLNHRHTKTNKRVGPTIVHMAITNNAHLTDLEDFEEVLSLSADLFDSNSNKAVVLSSVAPETTEESTMDLDELIAIARDEHGIDIPELQKAASKADSFAALSAALQEKLAGSEVLALSASDETATAEDLVAAVASIVETNVALSATVAKLDEDSKQAKAEALIEEKVAGGFITPAKRDAYLKLYLSDPETFADLLPETPLVALSAEEGQEVKETLHDETIQTEIDRITADGIAEGSIRAN